MIERQLTYTELGLTNDEVFDAIPCDEASHRELMQLMDQVRVFLHARFAFVTTGMDVLDRFNPGRIILSQLRGSEALCWFVATAGHEFEGFQRQLMQRGDMVHVYLANELGSLIAERTADRMEELLQLQLTPKGLHRTNRYSPGYCGWKVSEQPLLFELFKPNGSSYTSDTTPAPCGIHLTDSCLMVPIKSVSGVIGISHDVRRRDYICGLCELKASCRRGRPR